MAGVHGDQQVVQVAAASGRTSLDEDEEVVRSEDRGNEVAEQIAYPGHRVPVDLHPVASRGSEFDLEQRRAATVLDLGPQDRTLGAHANECLGGDAPERRGTRQPGECLHQVRLALGVVADHGGPAVTQFEVDLHQVPEVDDRYPPDRHRSGRPV